ncbi:MAG: insulinase family protein [Clostridiales bacterium]|nr:insulinase family protein [Clostridiales bacterium]
MIEYKKFDNGLRLIINKMDNLMSVSAGILVKTGSANESQEENGISHFIEHVLFKGTSKRTAFEISDHIDRIGAQINAFTSKELTCYYTKSTTEHLSESLDVLSDIFFNSVFDKAELEKEKGVVIEEINMCNDTPEDLCLDLLAECYYGKEGLGRTILGPAKNIRRFNVNDINAYMDKYYTADNVVISIAGNVDVQKTVDLIEKYFAMPFKRFKSQSQVLTTKTQAENRYKYKKIEQAHIGIAFKGCSMMEENPDAFGIANTVLGGGMSSRLFQKIREELGLAYSVYSYPSTYKDNGLIEIYAGVNSELRDLAVSAIIDEVKTFKKSGITEAEFLRGKEQVKSSLIMGQESTASQMLLYGKMLIFKDLVFDFDDRLNKIINTTIKDVHDAIDRSFDIESAAFATVGASRKPLKLQ